MDLVTILFAGVLKIMNKMFMEAFFLPMQGMIILLGGALGKLISIFSPLDPSAGAEIYKLTSDIVGFLETVKTFQTGAFDLLVDSLAQGLINVNNAITTFVSPGFSSTKDLLVTLASAFSADFGKYVKDAITNADTTAMTLLNTFKTNFVAKIQETVDEANRILSQAKGKKSKFDDAVSKMKSQDFSNAVSKMDEFKNAVCKMSDSAKTSSSIVSTTIKRVDTATDRVLQTWTTNLEKSGQKVTAERLEGIARLSGASTGTIGIPAGYASDWYSTRRKDDFIMRPGQSPVSFNPNDTIIGTKAGGRSGGNTVNITINGAGMDTNTLVREISKELQRQFGVRNVYGTGF
jgi:hypothetical protein